MSSGDAPRRVSVDLPLRSLLLIAAVASVLWAFASIRGAFLAVFVGIFLALVFEYPVRYVMRVTRLSRGLAATVTFVVAFVAVIALATLLLVPFASSLRGFLESLPGILRELRESGSLDWLPTGDAGSGAQQGADAIAQWVPSTISGLLGVAGNAASVLIGVVTIVFAALFLLTDIADLRRAVASVLTPAQEERWLGVWDRVTLTVSRWAIGVVVIGAIAGLVQGVTAWILGSSFALALGLIAGFLDAIPNIGATLAGVLLTLVLLAEQGPRDALIMGAVVLIYQQLENNLVTPTVQGRAVRLSGFIIIVAVALFGALMGVLGAVVAVPIAASIQIIVQELTAERRATIAREKVLDAVADEAVRIPGD